MDSEALIQNAIAARNAGLGGEWIARLQSGIELDSANPRLWHTLGTLFRAELDSERAIATFEKAVQFDPASLVSRHALARTTLESGQPAVALYDAALALDPGNQALVLGKASALAALGEADQSIALLDSYLKSSPNDLDTHRQLVETRVARGEGPAAFRTLDAAIDTSPNDIGLLTLKLDLLHAGEDFERLLQFADELERRLGPGPGLATYQAIAASETGRTERADRHFSSLQPVNAPALASHLMRHLVRNVRIDEAIALGTSVIGQDGDQHVWPWLGLAWQMVDDPRADWLFGQPGLIETYDVLDSDELQQLGSTLRSIHTAREGFLGQSVRGGTQTDGPLLARSEPEIQALRLKLIDTVGSHIDALPIVPGHPVLQRKPDKVRIIGSWSVLLRAGSGYHTNHVHPNGLFSSALYIDLPETLGPSSEEGMLVLGEPPKELGLEQQPFRKILPRRGRLALFPSILFHGTTPFTEGERLSVAFDIAP